MVLDPKKFQSPIVFQGGEKIAYRDPAVVYDTGRFHLFFTLVKTEEDGVFLYIAKSESTDLINFSEPQILTPKDASKNYSSPGNIIRFNGKWVMCFQTYCRENGEKYGNARSRVYIAESEDLLHFSEPRLLKVKGSHVSELDTGRMIDPYLLEDKDEKGKWWCFYKQNGISMSYSYDLENWTYYGRCDGGENVSVMVKDNQYLLFHSPENGIGMLTSPDLFHWQPTGDLITLGQAQWDWAKGRITAAVVMDISLMAGQPLYIMLFHGSGPENEQILFDTHASIGLAYSDDLIHWQWNKDE